MYDSSRPRLTCDVECLRNYFLIKFKDVITREIYAEFPLWDGTHLDYDVIRWIFYNFTIVTFNGNHYDIPMISAALCGYDCATLRQLSDSIILGGVKSWEFYRQYDIPEIDQLSHIDLIEVAPGVRISLKMYMGRMHSRTMQDLPGDHAADVSMMGRVIISRYCGNDLEGTCDLLQECNKRLALREEIGREYGIDVMSKSDAQISESVIKSQLSFKPEKMIVRHGTKFKYVAPGFIKFVSSELRNILQLVQSVDFTVNDIDQIKATPDEEIIDSDGKKVKTGVKMPPEIKKLKITIGKSVYKLGIGGLHSQESSQWFRTIAGYHTISDHDVAGYYPELILLMGMYPEAIGPEFIPIFRRIVDDRLAAKAAGDKTKANGLKIVVNGAFGKLGSKYSILFAPELLIRTTISGQLALLMLIEMLELQGIRVVSANTDGIVLLTPVGKEWLRDQTMIWWQHQTGLEMEATFYSAIYSRDVNNYIAFKTDGTAKRKGVFGESGVTPDVSPQGKHPSKDICSEAVVSYLGQGIPIEQTIKQCRDIRKFVCVRNVKGGGEWVQACEVPLHTSKEELIKLVGMTEAGPRRWSHCFIESYTTGEAYKIAVEKLKYDNATRTYLGKAVRWYYSTVSGSAIHAKGSGNKVADTDGAVPCMTLPDELPTDIDYQHYINDAYDMLSTLGVKI